MVEENPSASSYAAAVETLRVLGDVRSAAALLQHARQIYPQSEQLRGLGARPAGRGTDGAPSR
jgi:hypothetical protein